MNINFIRNFSIIAHIDHGKSTLADRMLEITQAIPKRIFKEQFLDAMDLERERGITVKAHTVTINYQADNKNIYQLNLIDTPGHVDFSYEVSRSLSACEGVILLIDAVQGVEAQTLSNFLLAQECNLTILPIINKIDLPNADISKVKKQLEDTLKIPAQEIMLTSAKTGQGIKEIMEQIIKKIPPPKGEINKPLKALIFDSYYNSYRGVIIYIRVYDGLIKPKTKILLFSKRKEYEVEEVGILTPTMKPKASLTAGEVGYLIANIKNIKDTKIGDTITFSSLPIKSPLPGYKEAKPMVFAGFYPQKTGEFEQLKNALEKLSLNDASFIFSPESSVALGIGFKCGFLGLLHMEIIQERLEREYKLDIIITAPSVFYKILFTNGKEIEINTPKNFPSASESNHIKEIQEPYIAAVLFTPEEYIGEVMQLAEARRGIYKEIEYIDKKKNNSKI